MAKGDEACRDCERCNRSALGKLMKGSVRATANVATVGVFKAMRRTCGKCGHPLANHTGEDIRD